MNKLRSDTWLICADELQARLLCEQLVRQARRAGKELPRVECSCKLDDLFSQLAQLKLVIIVDENLSSSALNLVAAIRAQSRTLRIVLVHKGLSDSLRYRAELAGVNELVEGLHYDRYDFVRSKMQEIEPLEDGSGDKSRAKQLCFTSIQGSVGLSTLSFLLAAHMARLGIKTAYLQIAEQFSINPLSSTMSFDSRKNPYPLDSFERIDRLSDAELKRRSLHFGDKLYCYVGTSSLQRYEKSQEFALRLHERLVSQFDLVLTELPNIWSELHPQIISQVDRVVMVLEERAHVEDRLKSALSFLEACAIPRTRIQLLINKSKRKRRDRTFVERLNLSVGAFPLVSFIEAQPDLENYIKEGSLYQYALSDQLFSESLGKYARVLMQELALSPIRR